MTTTLYGCDFFGISSIWTAYAKKKLSLSGGLKIGPPDDLLMTGAAMSYVLALFLPFLAVMFKGRPILGLLLLVLQLSLIGWLPAVFIAFVVIHNENSKRAFQRRLLHAVQHPRMDIGSLWAGMTGNRSFGQTLAQRFKTRISELNRR